MSSAASRNFRRCEKKSPYYQHGMTTTTERTMPVKSIRGKPNLARSSSISGKFPKRARDVSIQASMAVMNLIRTVNAYKSSCSTLATSAILSNVETKSSPPISRGRTIINPIRTLIKHSSAQNNGNGSNNNSANLPTYESSVARSNLVTNTTAGNHGRTCPQNNRKCLT